MQTVHSEAGDYLFGVKGGEEAALALHRPVQFNTYLVLLVTAGEGVYHVDFGAFPFHAPVLLFATPMQVVHLEAREPVGLTMLQFHGDFYCIEYHRPEVACNGLLFNNIYLEPSVRLTTAEEGQFRQLLGQLGEELGQALPSLPVLRAYLQLLLAKSSSLKTRSMAREAEPADPLMEQFRELLETHYLTLHKPSDYAQLLSIPPNTFTKRSRRYFRKTPSELIRERLVLEAKKRLHLTRSSIKEIAYSLKFTDEFYFSRFFKKVTGVSPQAFRERAGISVVAGAAGADLSK